MRVAVQEELLESRVTRALLVGEVEPCLGVEVAPPFLSARSAVHQAEGSTRFEHLRDFVEGGLVDEVALPGLVDDILLDVHAPEVGFGERILGEHTGALHFVAILLVATHEEMAGELPPRVAVGHRRTAATQIGPPPDVQLVRLEIGRALLDDELCLVPGLFGVLDVRDEEPVLAGGEELPREGRCPIRNALPDCFERPLEHLFVQSQSLGDRDGGHAVPLLVQCDSMYHTIM